jgi:hypothetical protein
LKQKKLAGEEIGKLIDDGGIVRRKSGELKTNEATRR